MVPPQGRRQPVYFCLAGCAVTLKKVSKHGVECCIVVRRFRERMSKLMQNAFPQLPPEDRQHGFSLNDGQTPGLIKERVRIEDHLRLPSPPKAPRRNQRRRFSEAGVKAEEVCPGELREIPSNRCVEFGEESFGLTRDGYEIGRLVRKCL